ncbi:MAG: hypothetical protein PHH28_12945 [Desulfuromonadaceae bacterium]|nr:hypothetical protein [Desulfuromonadaceae bacterium]
MKIVIYGLGSIAAIGLFVASLLFNNHRIAFIWVCFGTGVVFMLAFSLYWHDDIRSNVKLVKPRFSEKITNFTLSLGENGISSGYSKDALKTPKEPYNFNSYKPVKLYIDNGDLYADVKIYGGSGLPAIEIVKNELVNKPHNWDYNSNSTGLEIVDNNQKPIYQFYYKTPSHIVMNGIFPFPGGLILANEDGATINPSLPMSFVLKPIFKYPAWKYPGQLNDTSNH